MSGRASGAARIERAIRAANADGRPALAPFLTAGYPDREGFDVLVRRVASVSDVLEIGVPFSDPMADGATIQRSSHAALAGGVDLPWILDTVRRLGEHVATPVVLMSYLNPLLAFGLGRLARAAAEAGVAGLIVPDLPFEEAGDLRGAFDAEGIALIQLVTPVTREARLRAICSTAKGFVYAVTSAGTTGGSARPATEYLDEVRRISTAPVLAGFGIRTPEQLRRIGAHADGAVVGSALIEAIEQGEDPVGFLEGLRPSGRAAGREAADSAH